MKVSKILCISVILIQFIIIVVFITNKNASSEKTFEDTTETIKKNVDTLSFMLETSYGSGEYKEGTSTKWPSPSDGYIFNSILSTCQNGGELDWDDTNNVVTMAGNMSDKCYVYFDVVQKAVINEITTSNITTTSMTITINATKGTFDISKYYYSIDNGSTWNVSTSNVITVSNLSKGTEYTIKVYVQDSKGINSEYKSLSLATLNISLITFKIEGTIYTAEKGMTWGEWVNSDYSNGEYEVISCNGDAIELKSQGWIVFNVDYDTFIVENETYGFEEYPLC